MDKVLKFEKFISVNEIQLWNISLIIVTPELSKLDKSISVIFEHFLNISLQSTKLESQINTIVFSVSLNKYWFCKGVDCWIPFIVIYFRTVLNVELYIDEYPVWLIFKVIFDSYNWFLSILAKI